MLRESQPNPEKQYSLRRSKRYDLGVTINFLPAQNFRVTLQGPKPTSRTFL